MYNSAVISFEAVITKEYIIDLVDKWKLFPILYEVVDLSFSYKKEVITQLKG